MQIQLVPYALPQKLFSSSCFAMVCKTSIRKSGNILYAIHTQIGNKGDISHCTLFSRAKIYWIYPFP